MHAHTIPLAIPNLPKSATHLRRIRRKKHFAWEQADRISGGHYSQDLASIAARFPQLTAMELRVSVLVKGMLPSWRIAEMLGVCQETIDNHRANIRRKVGVEGESLFSALSKAFQPLDN